MKFASYSQLIIFHIIALILGSCTGRAEKNNRNIELDNESDSIQELPFAEKRIVFEIPEMENVICFNDIVYHDHNGLSLTADIYSPPDLEKTDKVPIVLIVNGYRDSYILKTQERKHMDFGVYVSWAKLIAASGMIAVTYDTEFSHSEVDSLLVFLFENVNKYNLDMNRFALFAASANTLAAQSLMEKEELDIKCAVLNYGIFLTPDKKHYDSIDTLSKQMQFYWKGLREISKIPEIPIFVSKPGRDHPIITTTTDYFINQAILVNAPVTYYCYPEGLHNFDFLDNSNVSKGIIKHEILFMKSHLLVN